MGASMRARVREARTTGRMVRELREERSALFDEGGTRSDWQRQLEDELQACLEDRLAFTADEANGVIEELRQKDDSVTRLEGLVAALRAFDELGAVEELCEALP